MPYSHYHDGSFHRHRRRRKWGRHYMYALARNRRQRRGSFSTLFVLALVAMVAWTVFSLASPNRTGWVAWPNDIIQQAIQSLQPTEAERGARDKERRAEEKARKRKEQVERERERNMHEHMIATLTNIERDYRAIDALTWDRDLQDIARAHGEDMSVNGFYSHINPAGEDASARGRRAGYKCRGSIHVGLAENIYTAIGGPMTPERTTYGWMKRYGHKENMLDRKFERIGVGIYHDIEQNKPYYATMLLC